MRDDKIQRRDNAAGDAEAKRANYDRLCVTLKGFRTKAIEGRRASGIEAIWLEDEEYYEGIDDYNRSEKLIKPTSPDGNVRISKSGKAGASRSTVFVEMTRPYVDAAAARVSDMLLPTDDRNFELEPTPIPKLVKQLKDTTPGFDASGSPVMIPDDRQPPEAAAPVQQASNPGQPPIAGGAQMPMRQATLADHARAVIAAAKESCEKAQTQIDDWLTECDYLDECRTVVDDTALSGVGILKGPFPKKMRKRAIVRALTGIGVVISEALQPASKRITRWNFYPDPDCGEDIQRGKYVFERDDISGRELGDLKGADYIDSAIEEALEEGPMNTVVEGSRKHGTTGIPDDAALFQIWYFHGYLSASDLDTLGTPNKGGGKQYPVIATIVNDRIIKASIAVLDSGEFPYDVFVWQRRSGSWAGRGVARQMRTEQDGVNAAVRAMMDNAGLSAGAQVIVNRSKIVPANGRWELAPRKVWWTREGEDAQNVRDAIMFIDTPSVQERLMAIVEFWKRAAEDATGLPMLLQGQLGQSPDTVGGMTLLNNNATTVLRRIAKTYDARITDRHISRYYEWLLLHGEDEAAKGDYVIKARGSSALLERDAQSQFLVQMLQLSLQPRFGLDPAKCMKRVLKSQRFAVEELEMSEEDIQKASQPPPDPRIEVATINAKRDTDITQAELTVKQQEADKDRALEQMQTEIDQQLAQQTLSSEERRDLEKQKVLLASLTLKLQTQTRLSQAQMAHQRDVEVGNHMVDLHKFKSEQALQPPTEPVGRSPQGQAFQA